MQCLNCGNHVHATQEKCQSCNMPIAYYGVIGEIPKKIIEEKISGKQCDNCSGIQSDIQATNCQFCNYPFVNSNNNIKNIPEERGFAWRDVGQSSFNDNASDHFGRKIFNLKTNGYKNQIS